MSYQLIHSTLEDLMQMFHTKKQDDSLLGEERRHLAVAYTELEKISAYVKTYLVSEECES